MSRNTQIWSTPKRPTYTATEVLLWGELPEDFTPKDIVELFHFLILEETPGSILVEYFFKTLLKDYDIEVFFKKYKVYQYLEDANFEQIKAIHEAISLFELGYVLNYNVKLFKQMLKLGLPLDEQFTNEKITLPMFFLIEQFATSLNKVLACLEYGWLPKPTDTYRGLTFKTIIEETRQTTILNLLQKQEEKNEKKNS